MLPHFVVIHILAATHLCTNIFEDRSHGTDPLLVTTAAGLSCIFLAQQADMLRARLSSAVVKENSGRFFWIAVATLWWVQPQQSPQGFRYRHQPTSGAGNQSREHTATVLRTYGSPQKLPALWRHVHQTNRSLKWLKLGLVLVIQTLAGTTQH